MYSKLLGGDLVALFSFTFLLYAENEQGIFDTILRGHIDFSSDPWPSISSSAKDLVKKMLRADPKERLAAVDVLSKFHFETSTRFGFVFIFFSFPITLHSSSVARAFPLYTLSFILPIPKT